MANTKRDDEWAEAKKKCSLNNKTIRMAKELGLNPKSLIKNIPNESQQHKKPVHEWIREMYEDRMAKAAKKVKKKKK